MLAVATAVSVSAAPVTAKKLKAENPGAPVLTAKVGQAPAKASGKKAVRPLPKVRTNSLGTANPSVFRSAAKTAKAPVKAPFKAPAYAGANLPKLVGSVVYADNFQDGSEVGLYTVPTDASQSFDLLFNGPQAGYGGVLVDNVYYTCEVETFWGSIMSLNYVGYDMTTGEEVFNQEQQYYTTSMTLDPNSGFVWAVLVVEGQYALATMAFSDEVEMYPLFVIEPGEPGKWSAIACDGDGELWGIYTKFDNDYETCLGSYLYKISNMSGTLTEVGPTGYNNVYQSDATFDTATNRLFWTICDESEAGFLAEVDLTTGAATPIYEFPNADEVCGLVVLPPEADETAPAAVTDLEAAFDGASLTGTVNFKAPATLYDGTAASGDLTYSVLANGQELATGSTTFGANVAAEVTVPAAGLYTFTVTVKNATGESPKAQVKAYVGADTPEATSVTVEYSNGIMNISWLPVTASVNGGYIDVENVTYTVQRMPDYVVVAEGIKVTSFADPVAEPDEITTYYYNVVAEADGLYSAPAQSNKIILGSIVPPFTASFDNDLDGFSTIDANGDGKTWMNYDGHARISYNTSLDMDDWLITPPIKFEAGKLYDIAADFFCQTATYPERIEVKIGKSAEPSAMTTVLLEPTEIQMVSGNPMKWSTEFVPETDGTYFVGFHGISDRDQYYLYVDNVSISAPKSADGPAAVTGLTVTPGDLGALTATVSFTTPDKALSGEAITSLTKVELLRNNEVINTWDAPAVATPLTYTDNLPASGDYTYSVVAYNEAGNGPEVAASVYVGVDYPAAIQNVHVVETANPGEVTITWDAVTATESGAALDPSQVTYQVYIFEGSTRVAVSSKISATTFTYQAVPAGQQNFVQYCVFAYTDRGEGEGNVSEFIPVGTPYNGFSMTSQEDLNTYILGLNSAGGGSWGIYGDNSGIPSQDGDDFFLGMNASNLNQYASLFTGYISLEGMVNPGITFYTYCIADADVNTIQVAVSEKGSDELTTLKTVVVNEVAAESEWGRVSVDLSAYAGKVVQVYFTATTLSYTYTLIDNIKVGSLIDNDLAAAAITAPSKVKAGAEYKVSVTVANDGVNAAENYSVELYADSELVATKEGTALAGGEKTSVDFDLTMSAIATEPVVYFAKVVYAADENETNNQTDNVTVNVIVPNFPVVDDLAGVAQDGSVKLTWSEPSIEAGEAAEAVTEDFEDADAFSATYGDWIFVDGDKSEVGGFQNMDLPGIVPGETKGSFWVWDQEVSGGNQTFDAHSGTKYLFALFRYDDGTTDDWAISPELDGSEQTISFYARSYSSSYPEKIEVYYSTGSTEPADFVKINGAGANSVPGAWTLYEATVPAGAARFAIRSCATSSFMLMVDDVTYIPASSSAGLDIVGYNVYRDGVKINDAVVEECEFTDANVEAGSYEYAVTVVYAKGESASSNVAAVTVATVGLDSAFAAAVNVTVADRNIVITGAAGKPVAVYATDGKAIYTGVGAAKTVVPAQSGVYVVKAADTVKKVLVK